MELIAVVVVVGVLATAAMTRFGHATLNTTDTEGFVRRLVLDLRQARRAAIATGDDHYLQLNRISGVVTTYDLYRDASAGAYTVQPATAVPEGTVVTAGSDTWNMEFTGELTSGAGTSTMTVGGSLYDWTISVYQATGAVRTAKAAN